MAIDLNQFKGNSSRVDLTKFVGRTTAKKEKKKSRLTSAKESFLSSLSSAKEKFGRARKASSQPGATLFSPNVGMPLLGALGDVVTSPLAGLTGLAQPEIEKGVEFAIEKTPEPVKRFVGEQVGKLSTEQKQFAGDTLSASALLSFGGTKEVAKRGVRGAVKKTGQKIVQSGKKSAKIKKTSFLDDLVKPKETATTAQAAARRSKQVGRGPFRRTVTELAPDEKAARTELMKIKKITPRDTAQGVLNKTDDELSREAKSLLKRLKKDDAIFNKNELKSAVAKAEDRINKNIFVGSESKSAIKRMLERAKEIVDKRPGKTSGGLQGRMDFDRWLKSQKGKGIFSGDSNETAIKVGAREIRKSFNDFVHAKSPSVDVNQSLKKQTTLFDALDKLAVHAGAEARTAPGRALQVFEKSLGKNKTIKNAIIGLGLSTGVLAGGGGQIAVGIGALAAGKKLFDLVKSPAARIQLGKLVQELSRLTATGVAPAEVNALKQRIEEALGQSIAK